MRLFIAIRIDDELKRYLRALQESLRALEGKVVFVKDFHLTLKFLGEVPGDKLPRIEEALAHVCIQPFTLTLRGLGFFPDERRPRVIWIGAEPRDTLIALQNQIDTSLVSVGFPRDTRFHPHLTVARVKYIREKVTLSTQKLSQPVVSFELIESTLTPQGPVYHTKKTFKNKA